MGDPTGAPASTSNPNRVVVPANPGQPVAITVTPIASAYPLDVSSATVVTTPDKKQYYRFPTQGTPVTNQSNRPKFYFQPGGLAYYTGPGVQTSIKESQRIQPTLQDPLAKLMTAMVAEGQRINDEGMKNPIIGSAWRSWEDDGEKFLKELKKKISKDPKKFPHPFPDSADLAKEAASNLSADSAYNAFIAHLGAADGWTQEMAQDLVTTAVGAKAPGGRSPHESGLAVDINFSYATTDKNGNDVFKWHDITTENNSAARLSASGKWLEQYAQTFDFSSYNTESEIWHYEWLKWKGTDADPAKAKTKAKPKP